MQVSRADAAVDEDTVMIRFGHAVFANAAMLRARGLEVLASSAVRARMEHCEVERILGHLEGVIITSDVAWVDGAGEVQEEVRADDGNGGDNAMEGCEERPGTG